MLLVAALLSMVIAMTIAIVSTQLLPLLVTFIQDSVHEWVVDATGKKSSGPPAVLRKYVSSIPAVNMSLHEFDRYESTQMPIVLTSAAASADYCEAFLAKVLDLVVPVSRIAQHTSGAVGMTVHNQTLAEFRAKLSAAECSPEDNITAEFVWATSIPVDGLPAIPWPLTSQILRKFDDDQGRLKLSMASNGRGTNLMSSRAFINYVIEGEQHWTLFKPKKDTAMPPIHPSESIVSYIAYGYVYNTTDITTPFEARLRPGDTIFVPDGFSYAFSTVGGGNFSTSFLRFVERAELGTWYSFFYEGMRALGKGDGSAALKLLKKAVAIENGESSSNAWLALGVAQEELGEAEAAEASYRTSAILNRRNADAYARLASLQSKTSKLAAAKTTIAVAQRLLALNLELLRLNESLQIEFMAL